MRLLTLWLVDTKLVEGRKKAEIKLLKVYIRTLNTTRRIAVALLAAVFFVGLWFTSAIGLVFGLLLKDNIGNSAWLLYGFGGVFTLLSCAILFICSQRFWMRIGRVQEMIDRVMDKKIS